MKTGDSKRNNYKKDGTREYYVNSKGYKMNLPPYLRNKIYTEEEKEKLWIEKLDKQERYVDGSRVDVSENDDKYYKLLYEAREKNERLGYGNDEINWDKRRYENERRNINYKKRKGLN